MQNQSYIKPCSCKAQAMVAISAAAYQDATYGLGMRVHTRSAEKSGKGTSKAVEYRCTVCGAKKSA